MANTGKNLLEKLASQKSDKKTQVKREHKPLESKSTLDKLQQVQKEVSGKNTSATATISSDGVLKGSRLEKFFKPNVKVKNETTITVKVAISNHSNLDQGLHVYNVLNKHNKAEGKVFIQDLLNNILEEWNTKAAAEIKKMQIKAFS